MSVGDSGALPLRVIEAVDRKSPRKLRFRRCTRPYGWVLLAAGRRAPAPISCLHAPTGLQRRSAPRGPAAQSAATLLARALLRCTLQSGLAFGFDFAPLARFSPLADARLFADAKSGKQGSRASLGGRAAPPLLPPPWGGSQLMPGGMASHAAAPPVFAEGSDGHGWTPRPPKRPRSAYGCLGSALGPPFLRCAFVTQ